MMSLKLVATQLGTPPLTLAEGVMRGRKGVSLVEILIGMIIVVVASIATLTYFSSALGNVNKQGNRRAALERARERLEQAMEANADDIKPTADGQMYELFCGVTNPCTWTRSAAPVTIPTLTGEPTVVDDLSSLIATTIQWIDDPAAGTNGPGGAIIYDTLVLDVRAGFVSSWDPSATTTDDGFHRVHIRTLRTP